MAPGPMQIPLRSRSVTSIISGKDILTSRPAPDSTCPTCGGTSSSKTPAVMDQPPERPLPQGTRGCGFWIDVWVGGGSVSKSQSDSCMAAITDVHGDPESCWQLRSGAREITANCAQYGETRRSRNQRTQPTMSVRPRPLRAGAERALRLQERSCRSVVPGSTVQSHVVEHLGAEARWPVAAGHHPIVGHQHPQ